MVERPAEIDMCDPSTWIKPVDEKRMRNLGAHVFRAEYTIPITPDTLMMAIAQLPAAVPRGNPTFIRVRMTRANIERDGRNKGGFAIEVHWPLADIFEGLEEELEGTA